MSRQSEKEGREILQDQEYATPYKAAHIANFILESAREDGIRDISILKLLKLVYIFFGWTCVAHPRTYLFSDPIEAWDYGPVVPSLYYELRKFGKGQIKELATLYDPFDDRDPREPKKDEMADNEIFGTLNTIWDSYKNASAQHLVALTHEEGSPWWNTYDGTRNKEIPKELIRNYYMNLYRELD